MIQEGGISYESIFKQGSTQSIAISIVAKIFKK